MSDLSRFFFDVDFKLVAGFEQVLGAEGRLTLERFVDLCAYGPARVFRLAATGRIAPGYDADFTLVDLNRTETITDAWSASKSGWTPYDGKTVTGWPVGAIVRSHVVMLDGEVLGKPIGEPARFEETILPESEPYSLELP